MAKHPLYHASVRMLPQLADSSFSSMNRITNLLLIVIIIRTTSFFAGGALQPQPQHHHGGGCDPAERAALLSFKMGITNDSNNLLGSWRGQDCCRWGGVECSNQSGQVVKLNLRSPTPDFPDYECVSGANGLYGEISPSLLSLKHLEHIDLSMNCLLGPLGHIPHFLGSMENLRYLNLSWIPFTGRVPSQLGNLSKLQYLDLSTIIYSGMYSTDITWLTKLSSLQYLSMSYVNLSGIADWPHTLNIIPSLRVISLSACSLDSASQSLPHFNLTKLEKLDLSFNYLGHAVASTWFWKATGLKYLDLCDNGLIGQIPNELGNMTSLQVLGLKLNNLNKTGNLKNLCSLEILDLSENKMSGCIMDLLPKCKRNKLQELHFGGNTFTGTLPNFIVQFTNLRILDLWGNQLVGSIPPGLGKLKCLTNLDISGNEITGPVPAEIGSLPNLIDLNLASNNLSGVITEEHLAGLKSLKYIYLSFNTLKVVLDSDWLPPFQLNVAMFASCQMGSSFPAWLQHQEEITSLDISGTSLKGEIPNWFWSTFSQAKDLNISNNQISGSLPAHLDGMSVEHLDLGSNRLTGPIPSLPTEIIVLDISNNTFSGTLPSNLEAPQLHILLINSNRVGGYLPESICKLQLSYLDLSNNVLEGEIPRCFDGQNMHILLLSNNSLSGKFPTFLRNNTNLEFLDLSWNKFSGRLPTWIGELGNLRFLLLHHNIFCDNIPVEITNIGYLQCLDLSGNNFSGAIPSHLTNLTLKELRNKSMSVYSSYTTNKYLYGYFDLSGIFLVVTKGQQLRYGKTLAYFVGIDLSDNFLTGEIPSDFSSLDALINLNLSSNQLSGKIPRMIGPMQSLASLGLSRNKLSGEIPSSLSSLSSLSYLNLSYNNLSGRIPSGRQLDTLNMDNPSLMYIGNSGLLAGHWTVFCTLLFKKTWRIAYFRFFDKLYDMIYVFVVVNWGSFAKNRTTD